MVELEAPFIEERERLRGLKTEEVCHISPEQMDERTWLCNGSGHASGVVVLMKAEKADGEI